ncbi:MAG: outer membrane beta-barrel protein [Luteimonas sp.]
MKAAKKTPLLVSGIALALLAASAAPAFAQESDSWTGLYVGGHAGGIVAPNGNGSIDFDTNLDGNFGDTIRTTTGANAFATGACGGQARSPRAADSCKDDTGGADWGVRVGYDWQSGKWVYGVLGEYSMNDVRDAVTAFSTTPASYTMLRKIDGLGAIRARIGYTITSDDRTLLYATGGVASGRVENSFTSSNRVNQFTSSGDDDNATGYQAGLGVERRIGDRFSVGLEYLYTNLQDEDARVRVARGTAPATSPFILVNGNGTDFRRNDDDFDFSSFRLTASYRF